MMLYDSSSCSKNLVAYLMYRDLINKLYDKKNIADGQRLALEWANYICQKLGLGEAHNWKIFKKNLAQFYFGALECRRFNLNNSLDEIISYIASFGSKYRVRMSVHKFESCCHSKSVRVAIDSVDIINQELEGLQPMDEIEIFPEASNDNSICFRRLSDEFGLPSYEAGFGQAMYVFENERGKHEVCALNINGKNEIKIASSGNSSLDACAINLFHEYENYLAIKANMIYRFTGIEYLSIEGYYDYDKKAKPKIVDFDLPFDYIFMLREG